MEVNRFYILATGPSINDITNKEWKFLKTQNTMGISWFAKKNWPTKYFYFHEGHQRKTLHILMKHPNWRNTYFITTKAHKLPEGTIKRYNITHTPWKDAFNGESWYMYQEEPPASFDQVWAKYFDETLFGFRGTLVASLNAAHILGGDEFFLCGVDLLDNKHFYLDEEPSKFNEALEAKGIELKLHSSAISVDNVRTIIDALSWLNNYIKIYVTTKKSLLYKEKILEYRPIIC